MFVQGTAETRRTDWSTGWARVFPCILGDQDLNREVAPRPVLAWELVDQVLPLLLCGLGKGDVLADGALAKKTSQGPHLWCLEVPHRATDECYGQLVADLLPLLPGMLRATVG